MRLIYVNKTEVRGFEIIKSEFKEIDILSIEKYDTNRYFDYTPLLNENSITAYVKEYKIRDYFFWFNSGGFLNRKYRIKNDFRYFDRDYLILFSQHNKKIYFYPKLFFEWYNENSCFIYKESIIFLATIEYSEFKDDTSPPYYYDGIVVFDIYNPANYNIVRFKNLEKISLVELMDSNLKIVVDELGTQQDIMNVLFSSCSRIPEYSYYLKGQKEYILDENLNIISSKKLELKTNNEINEK